MEKTHKSFTNKALSDPFLRNSVIFVFLSLLSAALNYVYYPVIAQLLSVEEFGATQSLIAILLQIVSEFPHYLLLAEFFFFFH